MTQRRRLDTFLVEQAIAAGAEFRDGMHVAIDSETELRIDGKQVEVGAVIGADGANGITARSLGLGDAAVNGIALEGNLSYEERLGEVSHPGEAQGIGRRAMQLIEGLAHLARNPCAAAV